MLADISNFYLGTPMQRPEFMMILLASIPPDIVQQYHLKELEHNGKIYVRVNKGMYDLPQAGLLAHQQLTRFLNPHGYFESKITPGLWTHETNPLSFTLIVNDFGIMYEDRSHVENLLNILKDKYQA